MMNRWRTDLATHRWLPLPMLGGAGLVILSIVVGTGTWADWFTYPGPPRTHTAYESGARLLRLFLALGGLALMTLPWLISRIAPRDTARTPAPVRSRELWSVVGLMTIAAILAGTRVTESLWYDEIAPWMEYIRYGPGPIIGNYFDPSNHILMSLLVWMSTESLGDSTRLELAFRLPAFLAMLGAVPLFYALGRAVDGPKWGAILALLGALAPVFILEAVEARGYAIMLFASCGMMLTFVLGTRGRPGAWTWYAVFAALGIWAHVVTVFVPIGHAVWFVGAAVFTREKRTAIAGLLAILLAAMLTLMLYAPVLPDFVHLAREQGSFAASTADRPTLFGVEGWHLALQLGGSWSWWASLGGLALVAAGLVRAFRQRDEGSRVVLATFLGGALLISVVVITGAWIYARFALFLVPAALLAMMLGLRWLAAIDRRVAAAAIVIVLGSWLADLALRPPKQPLRDAVAFVASYKTPDESVLGVGLFHGVIRIYYPGNDPTWLFTTHGEDDFERMLGTVAPRWVIVYYPHLLTEARRSLLQSSGYTVTRHLPGWADWGRGDVMVWERRDAASGD